MRGVKNTQKKGRGKQIGYIYICACAHVYVYGCTLLFAEIYSWHATARDSVSRSPLTMAQQQIRTQDIPSFVGVVVCEERLSLVFTHLQT